MALIQCPECSKEVSDTAKTCPNCGYPIAEKRQEEEIKNEEDEKQVAAVDTITNKKECPICRKQIGFMGKVVLKDCAVHTSCLETLGCKTNLKNILRMNEMTLAQVKAEPNVKEIEKNKPDEVCCPKCGSTQLTVNKKGFGAGKAIIGAAIFLPAVVLGFHGSTKIEITCLKCGKRFMAGKGG